MSGMSGEKQVNHVLNNINIYINLNNIIILCDIMYYDVILVIVRTFLYSTSSTNIYDPVDLYFLTPSFQII